MGIYCTTKWALEGFYETLAVEVEPFGIRTTIVEPGSVRNEFLASASWAPPMEEYAAGPAGFMRGMLPTFPQAALAGDPVKVAAAIVAAIESGDPPRRLLLGSDAYGQVHPAMAGRLAEVEAQRDTCGRTDADDYVPPAPPPAG
jgi:NAD(P)-dependent dehydrogenase (short-subunit alcohol dehydrogenase family)